MVIDMGHFANDTENQHNERMKILLVEDDQCTQKALTAFLKHLDSNMDIEVATNGDDALKRYLEGSHHDLVITDNVHPGVLGIARGERQVKLEGPVSDPTSPLAVALSPPESSKGSRSIENAA